MNNHLNSTPHNGKQERWEDFAFYSITLCRHYSQETRSYMFGVQPDDVEGHKAIRLAAFRTLHWELVREGRQDYANWYLEREEKQP